MVLVFIVRWVHGEGNLCTIYQFGVGNTILIKNIFHFYFVCGAQGQIVKAPDFCPCAQFSVFPLHTSFVKFNPVNLSLIVINGVLN
jgi:hypothetical protein